MPALIYVKSKEGPCQLMIRETVTAAALKGMEREGLKGRVVQLLLNKNSSPKTTTAPNNMDEECKEMLISDSD